MLHMLYLWPLWRGQIFLQNKFTFEFKIQIFPQQSPMDYVVEVSILDSHRADTGSNPSNFVFQLSFLISLIIHSKFPTFPQICIYSGTICLVSCQNFQFWPLKTLLRGSAYQLNTRYVRLYLTSGSQ
jgi:hypothetical protein